MADFVMRVTFSADRLAINRALLARAAVAALLLGTLLAGCVTNGSKDPHADPAQTGPRLQAVDLNNPVHPAPHDQPVVLSAAKNEWTGFALQITGLPKPSKKLTYSLRLPGLQLAGASAVIGTEQFTIAQILSMPVDLNRASFVRHTGLPTAQDRLPRALLPVPSDQGVVKLESLRNPDEPTNPKSQAGGTSAQPLLLWVDLHLPPQTQAGEYEGNCELLVEGKPVASVPVKLSVYDFVLPDERHLVMVSQLQWDDLQRLYPGQFEVAQPRLLHRQDERHAGAIAVLDKIIGAAQKHRATVVVPRLQPTVKWPAGQPPQVDWSDLDSVLTPWLSGSMFEDKTPPGFWSLPAPDYLERFDRASQMQYWAEAASHFDQQGWLRNSAVVIEPHNAGRVESAEAMQISAAAAQVLGVHPRLRVRVPLEMDQVQFATESRPAMVEPRSSNRLVVSAPGLVFAPPTQAWPEKVEKPQKWLRTDLPGLLPYIGAGGDERDVRLWAWLAFLRQVMGQEHKQSEPPPFVIQWSAALPRQSNPNQPADPNEIVWFYPGSWFGTEEPVPTLQLKWLRRAQQDYEYLWLARQRGETLNALVMARLMTKPVELPADEARADPVYAMMSGTIDPQAWDEAQRLLARTILLRQPGTPVDMAKKTELNLATLRWMKPQERPLLLGRSAEWMWDVLRGGNWVTLRLGMDIYNASDDTPSENQLGWTAIPDPSGWQMQPQPMAIPALSTYQVRREVLEAKLDLGRIANGDDRPLEVTFTHGHTRQKYPLKLVLPVAASERRLKPLAIDGALDDWDAADQIQDGPLVRLTNRPAVQRQEVERADTSSAIYSSWADSNFYLAFKLDGVSAPDRTATRNFVTYQFRRAWGEDLCQVLVQPVYVNNVLGPVLHLICKPSGQVLVERLSGKDTLREWLPLEGAEIRYAATLESGTWRGEVAIPWRAIIDPQRGQPTLLRFNLTQHRQATGQSASWAGPIDFGRDESFMGLLHLREPRIPGMGRPTPR